MFSWCCDRWRLRRCPCLALSVCLNITPYSVFKLRLVLETRDKEPRAHVPIIPPVIFMAQSWWLLFAYLSPHCPPPPSLNDTHLDAGDKRIPTTCLSVPRVNVVMMWWRGGGGLGWGGVRSVISASCSFMNIQIRPRRLEGSRWSVVTVDLPDINLASNRSRVYVCVCVSEGGGADYIYTCSRTF